jgi:hypothetical protein
MTRFGGFLFALRGGMPVSVAQGHHEVDRYASLVPAMRRHWPAVPSPDFPIDELDAGLLVLQIAVWIHGDVAYGRVYENSAQPRAQLSV